MGGDQRRRDEVVMYVSTEREIWEWVVPLLGPEDGLVLGASCAKAGWESAACEMCRVQAEV